MLLTTCKDDAQANYLKNRGEPGQWFQHKADYIEDQPVPRIRQGGFEIYEKSKATVGEIILPNKFRAKHEDDSEKIHIRLTSADARKIADKFHNQPDKWFDFAGNQTYQPPLKPKRLYTETAMEIADAIYQPRSHDWFVHSRPGSSASLSSSVALETPQSSSSFGYNSFGEDIRENRRRMRSSHADEWYRTPGKFDSSTEPRPSSSKGPRVKYEGAEYASRARGVGSELLVHNTDCGAQFNDGALPYRCNTAEAGDNCRVQTRGTDMARCLGDGRVPKQTSARPVDRVHDDDARDYLKRGRAGTMGLAVQGQAVPVRSKVRPEGEEFCARNRGCMGSIIDQNQNRGYQSPVPKARITTTEAQFAADRNKGVMSSIVGETSYRYPACTGKYHPRSLKSTEAQDIMRKSVGSSMKQLVENYRLAPEPVSRLRAAVAPADEGGDAPALGRAVSVGNLLTGYGRKVPPEVPRLRITGDEAAANAEKYRGRDFFKTLQQKPPSK